MTDDLQTEKQSLEKKLMTLKNTLYALVQFEKQRCEASARRAVTQYALLQSENQRYATPVRRAATLDASFLQAEKQRFEASAKRAAPMLKRILNACEHTHQQVEPLLPMIATLENKDNPKNWIDSFVTAFQEYLDKVSKKTATPEPAKITFITRVKNLLYKIWSLLCPSEEECFKKRVQNTINKINHVIQNCASSFNTNAPILIRGQLFKEKPRNEDLNAISEPTSLQSLSI